MYDENAQAILLLTTYFSQHQKGDPRPLTPTEYGRFAAWLREADFEPKNLLRDMESALERWVDPKDKITRERLEFLLGRGLAMSLALEKWNSAGIWILTRISAEYPRALKQHLKEQAPAVIFGVGNQHLLEAGGLGVVGSRNISEAEESFAKGIAEQASSEGLNVLSGGARGVDEIAMRGALEAEGTALGVLANDLMRTALAGKWRRHIRAGQLCLVSTYYPEASFNAGNAMGRNKYIYCLSDQVVVVRSDEGTGGTWNGAKENLKKGFVPLFVNATSEADGNTALIDMGATPISFPASDNATSNEWLRAHLSSAVQPSLEPPKSELQINSYTAFVDHLMGLFKNQTEVSLKQLQESYSGLAKKRLIDMLARAVKEDKIERPNRLHKYRPKAAEPETVQQSLFGGGE
tara:strand:+ start:467 stop:1687 length:1221 start_codon:yes stop_codon:yes gene_type:complete